MNDLARAQKLWASGLHSAAIAACDAGLRLGADADLLVARGTARAWLGDNEAGIRDLTAALELDGDAGTSWTLAIVLLRAGMYAEAWPHYSSFVACRARMSEALDHVPQMFPDARNIRYGVSAPLWEGDELRGRSIAIRADEGIGDNIFNARFVPALIERGAGRIVLEVQPKLVGLLEAQGWQNVEIVPEDAQSLPRCDCEIPWMMLPALFDARPGDVACPYLAVPVDRVAHWRERLRRDDAMPVIGISWAGGGDHCRSLSQVEARRLIQTQRVHWVSFERRLAPDVARRWAAQFDFVDIAPDVENDMIELAAALSAIDLLVTADNTVACFAGALGVRTWLLATSAAHWRWYADGHDHSPWFPSARLFLQQRLNDWAPVIERVRKELTA